MHVKNQVQRQKDLSGNNVLSDLQNGNQDRAHQESVSQVIEETSHHLHFQVTPAVLQLLPVMEKKPYTPRLTDRQFVGTKQRCTCTIQVVDV